MPASEQQLKRTVAVLRRHGATRVVLFGSAMASPENAQDLDVACSGLSPKEYLRAVGDLMDELNVPVDLVDLSDRTPFTRMIEEKGRIIYECR